jgi:histidinol-phosphate/aromatic aminotransferase/cobyric acid decarboxylase-like protein
MSEVLRESKGQARSPDAGFVRALRPDELEELTALLTDDHAVEAFVCKLHASTQSVDLKRGEQYPELLRATRAFRASLAAYFGVEVLQAQHNFGSNGSIDTLFTAAKIRETDALRTWESKNRAALTALAAAPSVRGEVITAALRDAEATRPAGGVLVATPTYFRNYESARAKGLALHTVPLNAQGQFDVARFVDAMCNVKPSIAMLVTPNNPTGIAISDDDILRVLEKLPATTWCIVDRTLVNTAPEISTRELLALHCNRDLVVLHSFSKYKSMSQHRVGAALYSNPAFAKAVEPLLPLSLSLEGCVKALHWLMKDEGFSPSKEVFSKIRTAKQLLLDFVARQPQYSVTDFTSNFFLLTLPVSAGTAAEVAAYLAKHGLHVMPGEEFPEPNPRVLRIHAAAEAAGIEHMIELLESKLRSEG